MSLYIMGNIWDNLESYQYAIDICKVFYKETVFHDTLYIG
jgi:hypothetical protein